MQPHYRAARLVYWTCYSAYRSAAAAPWVTTGCTNAPLWNWRVGCVNGSAADRVPLPVDGLWSVTAAPAALFLYDAAAGSLTVDYRFFPRDYSTALHMPAACLPRRCAARRCTFAPAHTPTGLLIASPRSATDSLRTRHAPVAFVQLRSSLWLFGSLPVTAVMPCLLECSAAPAAALTTPRVRMHLLRATACLAPPVVGWMITASSTAPRAGWLGTVLGGLVGARRRGTGSMPPAAAAYSARAAGSVLRHCCSLRTCSVLVWFSSERQTWRWLPFRLQRAAAVP